MTYLVVLGSVEVELAGTQPIGKFKNSQVVTDLELDEVCLFPHILVSHICVAELRGKAHEAEVD